MLPFTFAGVVLVGCMIFLNLTVSMGTINGLIFYANIVRANTAIFFPGKAANTFLSWFIAWLNLDLGIEMCFYDGFDAYAKTWMQLIFPVYIWVLVSIIIISSKYSAKVAKFFGRNGVQVLATLLFLSYAKLLQVTITIFQPAQLTYLESNTKKVVWNYDGNLDYLRGKHLLLFVTAVLFFILFFIPYTLILFGIQALQWYSHCKLFFWVNSFKPLLDAYTGPYKDKHYYWTGLLLLIRIAIVFLLSTDYLGNHALHLLSIIIVTVCLLAYLASIGGVYKLWPLNLMEYSFILNLAILTAGNMYCLLINTETYLVSQVSVSIALITTMLIILHHGIQKFPKINLKLNAVSQCLISLTSRQNTVTSVCSQSNRSVKLESHVTHSTVELTEPFMSDYTP